MNNPLANPPAIYAAIETYLTTIAQHPTAEDMMRRVLTDDFRTGVRGGQMWLGVEGLREHLAERTEFFDQSSQLTAVLSMTPCPNGDVEVTTRLDFFARRWRSPSPVSEEFTGTVFHTWTIRRIDDNLRISALIIDGFAGLNDNARRLIASPVLPPDVEE
jgi:hypothetical protein